MLRKHRCAGLLLAAGAADNTFTVSGWTKAATLSGSGGNANLISVANPNHTLTNTSLARTGRGAIAISSIEQPERSGGAANNTLSAAAFSGQVKLDGGGGNDTLTSGAGIALLLGGSGNDTRRAGSGQRGESVAREHPGGRGRSPVRRPRHRSGA
jgi:Ca2+-binding RTX toxin-like protein